MHSHKEPSVLAQLTEKENKALNNSTSILRFHLNISVVSYLNLTNTH